MEIRQLASRDDSEVEGSAFAWNTDSTGGLPELFVSLTSREENGWFSALGTLNHALNPFDSMLCA